jgi:hypothetical protein
MKKRLSLEGGLLVVLERGRPLEFRLDDLRLVFLVGYFNYNFKFLSNTTTQSVQVLDLDASAGEAGGASFEGAASLLTARNAELKKTYLCIADFGSNSVQVSFLDIKQSGLDIFGPLAAAQSVRSQKRQAWLATRPQVRLFGGGSKFAIVDEKGFAVGKKFISWADVALVKIHIQDNSFFKVASLLMIPHGVNTGAFGMQQFKYSLPRIKLYRTELYYAECVFWRRLAASGGTVPSLTAKLTTLKELHDKGVLSNEKFAEAKAQAIAELT